MVGAGVLGVGAAVLAMGFALDFLGRKNELVGLGSCVNDEGLAFHFVEVAERDRSIAGLQKQVAARALDPALATRSVPITPSREGIPAHSQATLGGAQTEMADIKIDLAWSQFAAYRVIIDRVDQGRVGIIYNAMRDSSGALHLGLNSSALGPGQYLLTLQGLTWRGEPVPTAWTLITIAR